MTQTNNEREALIKFKDAVKQLCNDFSSLQGNVYIKDVEASLDALCEQFIESPISQNEQQEAVYQQYEQHEGWNDCTKDTYENPPSYVDKVRVLYTSPPKQAIPEGWKLVRIEPTDEMCIKAREVTGISSNAARHVFISMINAAPTNTQSLAQHDNEVIERCATVADKQMEEYGGQDYYATGCAETAEAIRALKV